MQDKQGEMLLQEEQDPFFLMELVCHLLDKAAYIILGAVVGALLFGVYTRVAIAPEYQATAKLYVLNSEDSAVNLSDLQIGTYLAADYQEVFSNWHVHEMVIQRLQLPYTYGQLQGMVSVRNPGGTRILYITVTSSDPREAMDIANAYAQVAREFISVTMETREPNVFEEARLPNAPSAPSLMKNVVLGFLTGAFILCLILFMQFLLDDRIRKSEDVEKALGIPVLGMMPVQRDKQGRRDTKEEPV